MTYRLQYGGINEIESAIYNNRRYYLGNIAGLNILENIQSSIDGTKFYIIDGDSFTSRIWQISAASAGYIDSCSYSGVKYDFYNMVDSSSSIRNIAIKPDGSRAFVLDALGDDVFQLDIVSSWIIDSSTYQGVKYNQSLSNAGMSVSNSGDKLFLTHYNSIRQYTINSAWIIDSTSYDSVSKLISEVTTNALTAIEFSKDGLSVIVVVGSLKKAFRYSVGSPWRIESLEYTGYAYFGDEDSYPIGMSINSSGTYAYIAGYSTNYVYQYQISYGIDIDIEYDYIDSTVKIEDRHNTRNSKEYIYKWSEKKKVSFSVSYVTSEQKSQINSWWGSNTKLKFMSYSNTSDVFSCHIINTSLPIGQLVKPYTNLFKGKIELGSY